MTPRAVTPPEGEGEEGRTALPSPTNTGSRRGWDGQPDFEGVSSELRRRGVNADLRSLVVACSLTAIQQTIEWWDGEQTQSSPPGPGVLVEVIRRGGMIARQQRASSEERERRYADGICGWLNEQFPDLQQPSGFPHPAAFVAVTHLHHQHGRTLTKARHGAEIRAAVREWDHPRASVSS